MDREFWKRKRVFLTGHTGFKGAWLALWLQELGADVAGFSLAPPTTPSLFTLARVNEGMESLHGDIRDFETLAAAVSKFRPYIVIHMAAQSLVRRSYSDPIETYATNVLGTVHLFEAVRRIKGVKALINVTSDKCYENREWVWGYRENERVGGYDPYSSSKGCAELVTSAYRSSFFNTKDFQGHNVAGASVRAGNVIGGGDWATDRLIPDIMQAFLSGHAALVRNPHAIRPWQHVLEPLRGYLMLAQRLATEEGSAFAGAWNFGPQEQDARSVHWVMDRLCELWPKDSVWRHDAKPQPHEATYLKLDCAKAHAVLDWWPVLSLEQALGLTVDWYVAHAQGEDMASVTQQQIQDYVKHVANISRKEHEYDR